jgi:hypothetical protein
MVVFASHLSNAIKILKHSNIELLFQAEKNSKGKLHVNHEDKLARLHEIFRYLR